MNREEAIKIIDCYDIGFYDLSGEKIPADKLADAFEMAIEALRREEAEEKGYCHRINYIPKPCEVYEDYEHATLVDIKEPLVKHDREWIIGCIKHDGFIKTDRFDKANQIILEALQFVEHFDLLKEHESLQEVVRCNDCRWWNSETKGCKRNPSVEAWYETDFCKYGERQCNYFGERVEECE